MTNLLTSPTAEAPTSSDATSPFCYRSAAVAARPYRWGAVGCFSEPTRGADTRSRSYWKDHTSGTPSVGVSDRARFGAHLPGKPAPSLASSEHNVGPLVLMAMAGNCPVHASGNLAVGPPFPLGRSCFGGNGHSRRPPCLDRPENSTFDPLTGRAAGMTGWLAEGVAIV